MAKKFNKDGYGKVATENMEGAPVPRKDGLKDQTQGKGAGSRKIAPKRTVYDYTKNQRNK